jgi:hypothetical protein
MNTQQAAGYPAAQPVPTSLWRGEYDRIFRLMAAKKLGTARERRVPVAATLSPEGVP